MLFMNSSINQSHPFNSRQVDRHIWSALIILKLSYFGKNDPWKIKILWIFDWWDQEIDSWIMNHEPLIPTVL